MALRRRSIALWFLVLPALAVVAACGGSAEPDEGASAVIEAVTDQADQASAGEAPTAASVERAADDAVPATADEAVAADNETVAAGDAAAVLTGAPVPAPTAGAVQADASETASGGRFPSLDDPRVVLAEEATWLSAETLVLGAVQNDDARAYPVFMMTFHHVANDVLGGQPYLVTF